MYIKPIQPHEADRETAQMYERIREALGTNQLPTFFTYIGAYPDYLMYIGNQLTENLQNPAFKKIVDQVGKNYLGLIHEHLEKSKELKSWLHTYRNTPSFAHFQTDLDDVFITNVKLAFIFVALREAVKGWAVAAEKLPYSSRIQQEYATIQKDEFVYDWGFQIAEDRIKHALKPGSESGSRAGYDSGEYSDANHDHTSNAISSPNAHIRQQAQSSIEVQILPKYMSRCKWEFQEHMKQNTFWVVRIALEKITLDSLPIMPRVIFSPINVVMELTSKYKTFPELLYLLSEHFPTYSMQRMMFSGYMKDTQGSTSASTPTNSTETVSS